ncbi:MAG: hypothetical protein M3336_10680 [Chloroflexota bacterium]|nr:hypothetical protein [Chloroflexota bacterium]
MADPPGDHPEQLVSLPGHQLKLRASSRGLRAEEPCRVPRFCRDARIADAA